MQQIDISKYSARTALRFLLKQSLISRVEFKPGKLGWSKYELNHSLFKEIEEAILKGSIGPFIQKGPNSSSINNTTTTNNIDPFTTNIDFLDSKDIDIIPLEPIGFTRKHLSQIIAKINPSLIQESIQHFAYAMKYDSKRIKKYKDPLATFISVLKRGEAWIEPNYRSPKEIALIELASQRKAERERIEKIEQTFIEEAFSDWRASLDKGERNKYISDEAKQSVFEGFKESSLKAYFTKHVWPKNIPEELEDLKSQKLRNCVD